MKFYFSLWIVLLLSKHVSAESLCHLYLGGFNDNHRQPLENVLSRTFKLSKENSSAAIDAMVNRVWLKNQIDRHLIPGLHEVLEEYGIKEPRHILYATYFIVKVPEKDQVLDDLEIDKSLVEEPLALLGMPLRYGLMRMLSVDYSLAIKDLNWMEGFPGGPHMRETNRSLTIQNIQALMVGPKKHGMETGVEQRIGQVLRNICVQLGYDKLYGFQAVNRLAKDLGKYYLDHHSQYDDYSRFLTLLYDFMLQKDPLFHIQTIDHYIDFRLRLGSKAS